MVSREEELSRILLVQACEESDPEARMIPRPEREQATRLALRDSRNRQAGTAAETAAGPGSGGAPDDDGSHIAARAARLAETLERRHPALGLARGAMTLRLPLLTVLALSLLAGLGADALGGARRINLLSFPLLALLAWNVLGFLLLPLWRQLGGRERGATLAGRLTRAAGWLARRRVGAATGDETRFVAASIRRLGTLWADAAGPMLAARVRARLHLGALGFAAGLVAGMYVRGLAFEYQASWESTFLDAAGVSALLSTVLGPAAALLDALRPGLDPSARTLLAEPAIAALREPDGHGPAAPWIHLWALTTAGVILLPRAVLALVAGLRARRLASSLSPPLDAPYFLRLRAPERGEGVRVEVLPYSHHLAPPSNDALLELLHELFGNRARITLRSPLEYGEERLPDAEEPRPPDCRVVVFNLAQSPEQEVHGIFLERLRDTAAHEADAQAASDAGAGRLLVLLDEVPYQARVGDAAGPDRLAQRRRAWDRVVRDSTLRAAPLRPLDQSADATLLEVRAALWPDTSGAAA